MALWQCCHSFDKEFLTQANDLSNQTPRPWHSKQRSPTAPPLQNIPCLALLTEKRNNQSKSGFRPSAFIVNLVDYQQSTEHRTKTESQISSFPPDLIRLSALIASGYDPAPSYPPFRAHVNCWKTLQTRENLHIFMRPPCIPLATLLLISHIRLLYFYSSGLIFHFP